MTKHTPGPWAVNPVAAWVDCGQLDEDGDPTPVCALAWPTIYRSENETEANGYLIAAAPDMLEALQMLVADFADYPASERPCLAFDKARAAI